MKQISILIVFLFSSTISHGQIFDRILDRTQDKLSREISNRIVERISDEIARAAMKPIDKAIDDMLKERYEQDSIQGKTRAKNYNEFLKAFSTPVDLPENYSFDMTLKSETKDYNGDKNDVDMLLKKDGSLIGMTQYEDKKKTIIVFDMTNNIMAIYNEGKDGKEVVAMPSMLSLAKTSMVNTPEGDEEKYEVTIKKTGKTKKILDYKCEQWEIDDETTTSKMYVANEFPISWRDSFSQFLKEMMPSTRREEMPEGMVLKSETKTKKKNKKTTYEVKEIIDSPFIITNSEYNKNSYTGEEN